MKLCTCSPILKIILDIFTSSHIQRESDEENVVKRQHLGTVGEGSMGMILLFSQLFCRSEMISKQRVSKMNKLNF